MLFQSKPLRSILVLSFVILLFSSCGPRLDGSSDKAFKQSYDQMKKGLGKSDTARLNAAIKVIGLSTFGAKMNSAEASTTPSLDEMVRKILDGKTYHAIISMAEDSLKSVKQREIASVQKEIDQLKTDTRQKKAGYDSLKTLLSAIQGRLVKIDMNGNTPTVYFEFKNVSNKAFDHFTLTTVVRSASTRKAITNSANFYGGVRTLNPKDTMLISVPVSDFDRSEAPEVPWATIKYPVTNIAQYKMNAEAYATELQIGDKDIDLSKAKWDDDAEQDYEKNYHDLQAKLKEAQNRSENLDDIE